MEEVAPVPEPEPRESSMRETSTREMAAAKMRAAAHAAEMHAAAPAAAVHPSSHAHSSMTACHAHSSMTASHAAAMTSSATTTAATRECRWRQGKRHTKCTRDQATKNPVVHRDSSLVELQRLISPQEDDDQETQTIQEFQLTNATVSDTQVSFHRRAQAPRRSRTSTEPKPAPRVDGGVQAGSAISAQNVFPERAQAARRSHSRIFCTRLMRRTSIAAAVAWLQD
jgi:hypothetical protein